MCIVLSYIYILNVLLNKIDLCDHRPNWDSAIENVLSKYFDCSKCCIRWMTMFKHECAWSIEASYFLCSVYYNLYYPALVWKITIELCSFPVLHESSWVSNNQVEKHVSINSEIHKSVVTSSYEYAICV